MPQCAAEAGVERLIHFFALDASALAASSFFKSKAAGEAAVRAAFPSATIVRPAPVYGPEDSLLLRYAALIHHDSQLPFLAGHLQKMSPVWVGDVAAAVTQALVDPSTAGRTLELTGPDVLTDIQVAHRVMQIIQEDTALQVLEDKDYRRFLTMKQFEPHYRKYYPADLYDQLKVDLVASGDADVLTLADLGLPAAPLEKHLEFSLKTLEHKEIEIAATTSVWTN